MLKFYSATGTLRATVDGDGAVRTATGEVKGFVNPDGSAGNAAEEFLGEINQSGQVMDATEATIGYVDSGHGTLRDQHDSHFALIGKDGEVRDHLEALVARIEGFTSYNELKRVAAYVFYFDQALIRTGLPSLVESAVGPVSPRAAPVSPRAAEPAPSPAAPIVQAAPVAAPAPASAAPAPAKARPNVGSAENKHDDSAQKAASGIDSRALEYGLEDQSLTKEEERLLRHVGHGASRLGSGAPKTASAAPKAATPAPAPTQPKAAAPVPAPAPSQPVEPYKPAVHTGPVETDDRGLRSDAARREEERIARSFGLSTASKPAASSGSSGAGTGTTHSTPHNPHPVPVRAQAATNYEVELWREINSARTTPQGTYLALLKEMKAHFNGNDYKYPGTNTVRKTVEGVAGVDGAIAFLEGQRSLQELRLSPGLSNSSKDLAELCATTQNFGSLETDAESDKRLAKYGSFYGSLLQNIALGNLSPKDNVLWWIIDDGNTGKQHRGALFDVAVSVVGIASGPHLKAGRVVIAAFTGTYTEGTEFTGTTGGVYQVPADAPLVDAATEFKLGPFTETKDRHYIEITNLGCPAKALKLRLVNAGVKLEMYRKVSLKGETQPIEQRQILGLPWPITASQVSAEYSVGAGKLTINIKKAAPGAAAPGPAGATTFDIASFTVPAESGAAAEKPSVSYTQSGEYFQFTVDPIKYETQVTAKMDNKKLAFQLKFSIPVVVDGNEAVNTTTMNSSFTIPFDVVQDQVQVLPNPGKGQLLKIFKVRPAVSAAAVQATASVTAAPAGVQVDTDIPILSKS